jgi:hypothetical protein
LAGSPHFLIFEHTIASLSPLCYTSARLDQHSALALIQSE